MVAKPCKRCQKNKPVSDYAKDRKRPDGLQVYCNACHREEARATYRKNPGPYKARAKAYREKLRPYLIRFADQVKSDRGCACRGERTVCVLDFHHLTRGVPVTRAVGKGISGFQKEIKKCVVVCCNCHRKIHAGILDVDPSMACNVTVPKFVASDH